MEAQLQPIDVEGQPQQHGLPLLRLIASPRRFRRQLPLHRREDALDLRSLRILLSWKTPPHLSANAFDLPRRLAALGRDDALGPKHLPDVLVVALRIKLGVSQYQADRRHLLCHIN